jgi:hypothetical protein
MSECLPDLPRYVYRYPMTTPALKPCPFCGSAATLEDERLLWVARCTGCGVCVLGDRASEPEQEMPSAYWEPLKQSAVDRWNRRAAPPAPEPGEVGQAVGNCARIELVVALHSLASQFENETAAFTGDDLKAVQGHVKHARKVAAKHNQNGPGCAPPAQEVGAALAAQPMNIFHTKQAKPL